MNHLVWLRARTCFLSFPVMPWHLLSLTVDQCADVYIKTFFVRVSLPLTRNPLIGVPTLVCTSTFLGMHLLT